MTKQALFYENPIPLSAERHRDCAVEAPADYRFAGEVSSVPLAAVEFAAAAPEYPIVFVGTEEGVSPIAVLGIQPGQNLYVESDGKWNARYIPAFVRRYPFVFASTQDSDRLTLCVDEHFSGWNKEGRGKRLFDINGDRTEHLHAMLKFLEDYQRHAQRTQAFCKKLGDLDLLEPMRARFNLPSGEAGALGGFSVVSREKLIALSGEQLSELAKTGALELAYLHLLSMRNLAAVIGRMPEDILEGEAALGADPAGAGAEDAVRH